MKINKSKININNYEELEQQENENDPINNSNNSTKRSGIELRIKKGSRQKKINWLFIISVILFIFCIIFMFIYLKIYFEQNLSYKNLKFYNNLNISQNSTENDLTNLNITNNKTNTTGRIGVAFVYKHLFGNGIGRMLSLLCSQLAKLEKFDIYMITGGGYKLDFEFDERVIMVRIGSNKTLIQKYDETSNIKIYVLQNDLTPSSIKWYQNLNGGKKVIGIMHGVYMSSIFSNQTGVYSIWKYNQLFDAYVQNIADDYYVNKKLGINNSFFLPNLFTFEADETPSSELTYNNLMIMGRELDRIKGGKFGIKAMSLIVKEVPDAKLYFISANYNINFLEDLIKELNLTENIEVIHYTQNISKYFLNSSILLCPSLSESYPMVMNEGKAHGLPIVAFNVSYSPPYQRGVIVCDITNYTQMAEESIKLLKDFNYRKKKAKEAKDSLSYFSNKETVEKWARLFEVLVNNDMEGYKKLQEYTFEKKYYDDESAREHLEYNWNKGKEYNPYFCCHNFEDMLNITYINEIKPCKNQSLCQ